MKDQKRTRKSVTHSCWIFLFVYNFFTVIQTTSNQLLPCHLLEIKLDLSLFLNNSLCVSFSCSNDYFTNHNVGNIYRISENSKIQILIFSLFFVVLISLIFTSLLMLYLFGNVAPGFSSSNIHHSSFSKLLAMGEGSYGEQRKIGN